MCLRKTRPRPHRVRVQEGDRWEINKHETIMWSQVCHQEKQEGTLRNWDGKETSFWVVREASLRKPMWVET